MKKIKKPNSAPHQKEEENVLLPHSDVSQEEHLTKEVQIERIIQGMPSKLSDLEKAFYIYVELGKILKEDPNFLFADYNQQTERYSNPIDKNLNGICKSISELYVEVLKDKRIGIHAELVLKNPGSPISHVDTILCIGKKKYLVNLIGDLYRIKTHKRIREFGIDLKRPIGDPVKQDRNISYLDQIEKGFGKLSYLSEQELDQLCKKIHYSYFMPKLLQKKERGMYTEDTIDQLAIELMNVHSDEFKKYVLKGKKGVDPSDYLLYQLEYLFDNIEKFTEFQGDMNYQDRIRYYISLIRRILPVKEAMRIRAYGLGKNALCSEQGKNADYSEMISIVKVKANENSNVYYLYDSEQRKYQRISAEDLKKFLQEKGIGKDQETIVHTRGASGYATNIQELEL